MTTTDLLHVIKAGVAGVSEAVTTGLPSGSAKFFTKQLAVGFAMYDVSSAVVDMSFDLAGIYVAASSGNDPLELKRLYDRMNAPAKGARWFDPFRPSAC